MSTVLMFASIVCILIFKLQCFNQIEDWSKANIKRGINESCFKNKFSDVT